MAKSSAPILLGAGALALVVGTKKKKPKPRFGIQVTANCHVDVIDEDKYRAFLRGAYLDEIADNPGAGPIQLADALFADVAPLCKHFPEDPESMDIFRLYLNILGYVSNFLVEDGRLKPKQILDLREDTDFLNWQERNLERLSQKWGAIPEDAVGFAKDYSEYRLGKDWEEDTLAPFVMDGKNEGMTNQEIFDAFVQQRHVLVGEHKFIRIADLPSEEPAVQEFLDRIIDGIGAAG